MMVDDFVAQLKAENADWLSALEIQSGEPTLADLLAQRSRVSVTRVDGTHDFVITTDVVDEHVLRHALEILKPRQRK